MVYTIKPQSDVYCFKMNLIDGTWAISLVQNIWPCRVSENDPVKDGVLEIFRNN